MSRAAPPSPVSPRMFRHFAVATLAITACLAIFAQGEQRQAFEQRLAEKKENRELKNADLELAKQGKGGKTGLVFKDNRRGSVNWAPDEGAVQINNVDLASLDEPMQMGEYDYVEYDSRLQATNGYEVPPKPPEMSQEEYEYLLETARKRKRSKSKKPTQKERDRLLQASRARSGSASGSF